jgi:hypothetical protein
VMTEYLNPFLEFVNFWRWLEWAVEFHFGLPPRARSDREVFRSCVESGVLSAPRLGPNN